MSGQDTKNIVNSEGNHPHVFMVITKGDVGGAQIHVLSLIDALKDRIKFTLGCGEKDYLTSRAEKMGIEVILIPHLQRSISPILDFKCYRALKNILLRIKPDLIHLHSSKAGVIGRLAARSTGIKSLFTAHGWAFTEGAGFKQIGYGLVVEWVMAKLGDGIIAVSSYDFELAKRFRVQSRYGNWVIQNCVYPVGRNTNPTKTDPVQLLNIGRMVRQKNQQVLLRAVASMKQSWKLTIVGTGHLKSALEALVVELGIDDRVVFIDEPDNILPYFLEAQIFVLSSDYEGLPLSILEAMSASLPVVSTNVGGVREAVEDGTTGFLVDRGDYKMLGKKLDQLVADPNLRGEFSENTLKRYQDIFQLDKMSSKTLAVYQELI